MYRRRCVASAELHLNAKENVFLHTPKKDIPFPFKNLNQVVQHITEQIVSYGK
jgi:hypothetical protein